MHFWRSKSTLDSLNIYLIYLGKFASIYLGGNRHWVSLNKGDLEKNDEISVHKDQLIKNILIVGDPC